MSCACSVTESGGRAALRLSTEAVPNSPVCRGGLTGTGDGDIHSHRPVHSFPPRSTRFPGPLHCHSHASRSPRFHSRFRRTGTPVGRLLAAGPREAAARSHTWNRRGPRAAPGREHWGRHDRNRHARPAARRQPPGRTTDRHRGHGAPRRPAAPVRGRRRHPGGPPRTARAARRLGCGAPGPGRRRRRPAGPRRARRQGWCWSAATRTTPASGGGPSRSAPTTC